MRLITPTIFTLTLIVASPVLAEPKRDIRGFFPGMPRAEFESQFKASNCQISSCKDDQGTLSFVFSEIEGKPLKEIAFVFRSGTAMDAMIALVAKQYSVPLPPESKIKANVQSAIRGHPVYSPGWFGTPQGIVLVPGGLLAKWQISKDLHLQLDVSNAAPPFEYKLFLTSDTLVDAEKRARADKKNAEEAARRAVNPAPKF